MDAATISCRPHDAGCMTMHANVLYELDKPEDAARLYERLEKTRTNPTSTDEKLLMKQGQPTYFQHASIVRIRRLRTWT